ncbi:MAG: hypothetical protein P1U56_15865 [Saprospiraceae bacterium]|nr:hypothetical protein [Saprospiraceae bacterium]
MAMIINKMLRVIPKKQKITEVDCHSICSTLAITGGELWEKVIYYINEEENCLDIKYKSRRGRGELGIEDNKEEFDVWVISNYEGGPDYIYCLNARQYELDNTGDTVNLYRFDEVRIGGDHSQLIQDIYPHFFYIKNDKLPDELKRALRNEKENFISFQLDGLYTEGTTYQVGETYSREPELLSREEFFKPTRVSFWEAQFLYSNHQGNYSVQKLLEACQKDRLRSYEWSREHLHEIQYCFQGRVVKKIETGVHWMYYNSEFFDNSAEKNWVEYMGLYHRGLI